MENTLDLIERYVAEVARRLPQRVKDDVAAELRSSLDEAYETAVADFSDKHGRLPTNEDGEALAVDLVKNFGSPAALAASYRQGPQWLIGPELYPAFLQTLKVVVLVIVGLSCLSVVVDVLDDKAGLVGSLLRMIFGGLFSDLVSSMGWVVLVFWIIQLTSWRKHGAANTANGGTLGNFGAPAGSGLDEDSWDPRELPRVNDPDRIGRTGIMVEIVVMLALLVLFNLFPQVIGASVEVNGERGWVPILGDGFLARRMLLNLGFAGTLICNLMLLRYNRWTIPTRVFEIALNLLFFIALVPLATTGGAVALNSADLLANGWSAEAASALVDDVFPILDWVLRGVLGLACIGLVIELAKNLFRLVKRLGH